MGGGGKGKKGQGKDAGVFELTKYLNQVVQVKFTGGREVKGKLKGYDPATNIVLDEAEEYKRGRPPISCWMRRRSIRKVRLVVRALTS